jgi:hypothetical protein
MNCRLPGVSWYAFTTGPPLPNWGIAQPVTAFPPRAPLLALVRAAPAVRFSDRMEAHAPTRSQCPMMGQRAGLTFALRLRLVSPLSEPARRVA